MKRPNRHLTKRLWDFLMPNGKPLHECTFQYVAEVGSAFAAIGVLGKGQNPDADPHEIEQALTEHAMAGPGIDANSALQALASALNEGSAAGAVTVYAVKGDSILIDVEGTPFNLVLMPPDEDDIDTVAESRLATQPPLTPGSSDFAKLLELPAFRKRRSGRNKM